MTEQLPTDPSDMCAGVLRALPPEYSEGAKAEMRFKARRAIIDSAEAFEDMSDEWVADQVRMLMRNDLYHEAICTAARDRIMRLSLQVANLKADR